MPYRRKFLSLKKVLIFVLLLLLLIGVYLIINSSLFIIKNISLEKHNINCATDLEIQQASFLLGQNFLFLNTRQVEGNLKSKFICIKDVTVEKEFPDKIRLKFRGREARLLIIPISNKEVTSSFSLENIATPSSKDYSDIFLADDEGVIFSKGSEGENLTKIFIYGRVVNLGSGIADLMAKVVKILDKTKIFGIDIRSAKNINSEILVTDSQPVIIFKLDKDMDVQLASLQLILRQAKIDSNTLEFIDLRFDKPIVRFAPKKSRIE